MNVRRTVEINIDGIVQGCGFRPFLFNLARSLELKGYILNRGNAGVKLILQGNINRIERFIEEVEIKKPEISYIESVNTTEIENAPLYNDLYIKASEQGRGVSLTLPPDIAICEDCIKDMKNKTELSVYPSLFPLRSSPMKVLRKMSNTSSRNR